MPGEGVGSAVTPRHTIVLLAGLAVGLGCAPRVEAFSTGIAGTSFPVAAQGCNFCHAGGAAPIVTLACVDCGGDPPIVQPLAVHEFRLTVVETGLQDHAGLNVSALLGTLATGGGVAGGTQTLPGTGGRQEVTHTTPKPAAGGVSEFSFLWTAPAAPGPATLVGWGNAVNLNSSSAGDRASTVSLNISVDDGMSTPTDTPTPDPNTPTATPTPLDICPPAADLGCASGFAKGLLLVRVEPPGREKLVAKFLKGPALQQTDLGNPLDASQGGSGTAYALCIYDEDEQLVGDLLVDRAGQTCGSQPCWRPIGNAPNDPQGAGKGYRYNDVDITSDGVRKILYKGGDAGRSKVVLIGKGSGLPLTLPSALQSSDQTTVQLRSSDGLCLSVQLNEVSKQEPTFFKAK